VSEGDDLLKDLERLAERSKSSVFVNDSVDYTANTSVRRSLLEKLTLIHNQTADKYSQVTYFGSISAAVIRSHKGVLSPHNLVLDIENSDARLEIAIRMNPESGWLAIDSLYDRSLYFNEYEDRYNVLYAALERGDLDDCLGYTPEILIHSIMGLSGELLPRLGIDPIKGQTYQSLKSSAKPHRKMDYSPLVTAVNTTIEALSHRGEPNPAPTVMDDQQSTNTPPKGKGTIIGLTDSELGLSVGVVTREQILAMGINTEGQVIVTEVFHGSPAHVAGVMGCESILGIGASETRYGGDILLGINDSPVKTIQDFITISQRKERVSSLRVFRKNSVVDLQVFVHAEKQLTQMDGNSNGKVVEGMTGAAKAETHGEAPTALPEPIGIEGYTLTEEIASQMGLGKETRGVFVSGILPNSLAEKAGIRGGTTPVVFQGKKVMLGGDIIYGIEDIAVNNSDELRHYLNKYHVHGTKIKLNVLRNGVKVGIEIVY